MLSIYLPAAEQGRELGIEPGSGIVGRPTRINERVLLDNEGNLYGAVNIRTFADRVHHAASRAGMNYPTIARAFVERSRVVEIGYYDADAGAVVLDSPEASARLARWLELDVLPQCELKTSEGAAWRRRELEDLLASNPALRFNPALKRLARLAR